MERNKKLQDLKLRLSYFRGIINSWLFVLITSSIFLPSGLIVGITLGLNLPEQVVCANPNSLCYILRFRSRLLQ